MISSAVYTVKYKVQERPWHCVFSVRPQGLFLWEGKFNGLSKTMNFKPGLFLDCTKKLFCSLFPFASKLKALI